MSECGETIIGSLRLFSWFSSPSSLLSSSPLSSSSSLPSSTSLSPLLLSPHVLPSYKSLATVTLSTVTKRVITLLKTLSVQLSQLSIIQGGILCHQGHFSELHIDMSSNLNLNHFKKSLDVSATRDGF